MNDEEKAMAEAESTVEQWRPVFGYEGSYEVSNRGEVRSLDRLDPRGRRRSGARLNASPGHSGHLYVSLRKDGGAHKLGVHVLVLEAFVGPRPPGMDACHWNDISDDNRLENLRWDTRSANLLDCVRNGGHHMASRTHCPKGHEYTAENTYVKPQGSRSCRQCRRIYQQENHEQRLAYGREYMKKKRAAMRAGHGQEADL